MIEIIFLILLTSLFCNGLHIATQEKMILHFIRVALNKVFVKTHEIRLERGIDAHELFEVKTELAQQKISKLYYPILYCIKCMPSVYGTAMCFLFLPISTNLLYQIPIIIICSSALSAVIFQMYD